MTTRSMIWSLSVLIASCCVAGCGGGAVSEKAARTAYEKSTPAIVDGKAKLVSFRKINARSRELLGMKLYEVEYEAELQFLEDYPPLRLEPLRLVPGPTGKQGEIKKDSGWIPFQQTEKGWRCPDKNVY